MRTIIDILNAGWGTVYLRPYLNDGEYRMVLHINPYKEEWPNGWVIAPLPSGAILYRQNQWGLYDIIKYDPENQNGYRQLGLVETNYGEVNVAGGFPADPEVVRIVSDMDVVKIIVKDTIRYIDLDEAQDIAELVGAEVVGVGNRHFRLVGDHKMEVNLLIL